jgi:hypothetical protein
MSKKRGDKPEVELTEGALRVRWRGRVRTILPAQAPPDAEEAADFIILLDDLVCWDSPDQEVEIEMSELQAILEAIDALFDGLGLDVVFE